VLGSVLLARTDKDVHQNRRYLGVHRSRCTSRLEQATTKRIIAFTKEFGKVEFDGSAGPCPTRWWGEGEGWKLADRTSSGHEEPSTAADFGRYGSG